MYPFLFPSNFAGINIAPTPCLEAFSAETNIFSVERRGECCLHQSAWEIDDVRDILRGVPSLLLEKDTLGVNLDGAEPFSGEFVDESILTAKGMLGFRASSFRLLDALVSCLDSLDFDRWIFVDSIILVFAFARLLSSSTAFWAKKSKVGHEAWSEASSGSIILFVVWLEQS